MKIHEYNQMMKYLTRPSRKATEEKAREELKLPKDTKLTGSKMLNWINYNNKITGSNNEPITEEEKKVAAGIEAEQNKTEKFRYQSWADGLEKRTRPVDKKEPVKIVKKPKPTKPIKPVEPFYDWKLAPWWLYPEDDNPPPPEDKTEIKTGIQTLI